MNKTKQAYYDRFFENNWKNIKNIWKGTKPLISLKTVASSIPTVRISDSNESDSTIFLQPIDKEEIANIISRLNSSKASDPNTIPYRILFLLKNEISKQLADLFNLSFMTGVFPSVLKTAKVVPVFKKDSKLDYSNYRPISLLSNIEKILEKLMYKRLYNFLNNNNIICNLQFGFRQQYSISHALINITENIGKALDD